MYLNLNRHTYQKLLDRANQEDLPLATYINQLLEKQITQQGVKNGHGRHTKYPKQSK